LLLYTNDNFGKETSKVLGTIIAIILVLLAQCFQKTFPPLALVTNITGGRKKGKEEGRRRGREDRHAY
jgi:hypothetical protein